MMTSSSVSVHDLLIDNPFPGIQLVIPTDHDHHDHGGHYHHNWVSHHHRQLHQHQDQQVGSDEGLNQDAETGIDQARVWEHNDDHLYDPRIFGLADIDSDHNIHENWVPSSSKLKVAKKMNPKRASTANPTIPIVEISTDELPYFPPAENDSIGINSGSYVNNNNNIGIRVCSDCNTTKTPLWRSGPKGPKSLCNACGIRQRKARRALAAAAAATNSSDNNALTKATTSSPKSLKIKTSNNNTNKKIKSSTTSVHNDNTEQWQQPYKKRLKKSDDQYTSLISHDSNLSSDKDGEDHHRFGKRNDSKRICFEEFITRSLSKNAALHRVFPQDEKEAAILLMALSCGLVHN